MTILDRINRFIALFSDTLQQLFTGRIWAWLGSYFLLLSLILYALYSFTSPLFYGAVNHWVSLVDMVAGSSNATGFTHYPSHFAYLGEEFDLAKMAVAVVVEGLVLGAVARLFGHRFFRGGIANTRSLKGDWIHLVIAWLIINLLTFLAGKFLPDIMQPLLGGPRRVFAFAVVVMPAVYTLILALFLFTIPAIAVGGDSIIAAVLRSLTIFLRNPLTCFFLAVFILVGPITFSILSGYTRLIIEDFRPELVYWLLQVGLLAEMVANFLWMGTTVRFLSLEPERR